MCSEHKPWLNKIMSYLRFFLSFCEHISWVTHNLISRDLIFQELREHFKYFCFVDVV